MDPDDAADLLGVLQPGRPRRCCWGDGSSDLESVRRQLSHRRTPRAADDLSNPVVLAPDTTVAEALARVRDPDLTPALASLVFVVRPPTATPTGRYLGCVHTQALLREPPANLVSGIIDSGPAATVPGHPAARGHPSGGRLQPIGGLVVDEESHLLGAGHC